MKSIAIIAVALFSLNSFAASDTDNQLTGACLGYMMKTERPDGAIAALAKVDDTDADMQAVMKYAKFVMKTPEPRELERKACTLMGINPSKYKTVK